MHEPYSFSKGFRSVFSAMRLVFEVKGFAKFFVIPFLLNIALLTGFFVFSYMVIQPEIASILDGEGAAMRVLRFLLAPALLVILWMLTAVVYSLLGGVILSPFLDLLSQRAETHFAGVEMTSVFTIGGFAADIVRSAKSAVKIIGLWLLTNIALMFFNALPIIGPFIHSIGGIAATAFFAGFSFLDYPLSRRGLEFSEKLSICAANIRGVLGLGAAFLLGIFIPVAGFLSMNLAVISAAEIYSLTIKPGLDKKSKR